MHVAFVHLFLLKEAMVAGGSGWQTQVSSRTSLPLPQAPSLVQVIFV